jgi:hypothetical protein
VLCHARYSSDPFSKRTHIFRVIGQFMAKSMLDSRIIDLSFNKVFLKLVLGEQVSLTLDNLKVLSVFRVRFMLFTLPHSLLILTSHHPWRNYKGCRKNPTMERSADFRSRRVSLY